MFPYTNTDNHLDSLFKKQYFHQIYEQIQNPISESPFFSNFPSPFFEEQELPLNQIFLTDERNTEKESPKHQTKPLRRRNLAAEPRKRIGKTDRHSKICTAQGIRDRRMRLSLPVARKFFDLQDMLGYDKASKTIEWLFNQSKKAIKDLTEDTVKSESDCEVVSGIEENSNNNEIDGGEERPENNEESEKKHRRTANTRESREKARERARCRTEEKKMRKRIEDPKSSPNTISPNFEKLGLSSSSPFDRDEEERVSPCDASDYYPLFHQPSDVGTIEKLLANSSSSASNFATSCCVDPSFMGFLGIWDNLQSNERLNYAVIEASIQGNPNSIYSATTSDFALFHQ